MEHADSESLNVTWACINRHGLGQGGLTTVPPESSKIIDELIYRRLSPADRASVDRMHRQRACAPLSTKPPKPAPHTANNCFDFCNNTLPEACMSVLGGCSLPNFDA